MKMNCLILDDDELPRLVIEDLVKATDFLNLVKTCADPMEATNVLNSEQVDLLFLDVEMPGMTGIELIQNLIQTPQVILITSHEKYAVKAFEADVTDYIVKPVSKSRFFKAVSKAKAKFEQQMQGSAPAAATGDEFMFLKVDAKKVKVYMKEILWVEALSNYVTVGTATDKHVIRSTMKDIEEKLPSADFARVHRSFIVRVDKIDVIDDNTIDINGKLIPIGGAYKEELNKRLGLG